MIYSKVKVNNEILSDRCVELRFDLVVTVPLDSLATDWGSSRTPQLDADSMTAV